MTDWTVEDLFEGQGHGNCSGTSEAGANDLQRLVWVCRNGWYTTHDFFSFSRAEGVVVVCLPERVLYEERRPVWILQAAESDGPLKYVFGDVDGGWYWLDDNFLRATGLHAFLVLWS